MSTGTDTSLHVPGVQGSIKIVRRKPCEVCGRYITMRPSEGGKSWERRKRCSRECYYEAIRGRKLSAEHCRQISERNRRDPRFRTPKPKAEASPMWKGEGVGYQAVHCRLRQARGSAAQYACSLCTQKARVWGFRWDRAEQVLEPHPEHPWEGVYSTKLDDYEPMCASCHRRFDNTRVV